MILHKSLIGREVEVGGGGAGGGAGGEVEVDATHQ